ncbi:MAG: HpcH/HpaI aldolase/citrate lyase family protein [Lautropia sp.]
MTTTDSEPPTRLRRAWQDNRVGLCIGVRQARTPDIAQIAAACGFDALYVDLEHSTTPLDTAATICVAARALGVTPLVRVPEATGRWIGRVLDGGAQGVIVPHVESPEAARAIVEQAKYPPVGRRSVGGAGPGNGYRNATLAEINRSGNDGVIVTVMLETPAGIAAADEIAAVPGVDVLLIGSNDLCTELGIPGQLHDPRLQQAYRTVADACRRHDRVLGIGGIRGDLELQRSLVSLGARLLIAGNDSGYLMAAAREDVRRINAAFQAPA